MQTEPIYVTETKNIADYHPHAQPINVEMRGEKWDGQTLDTKVSINGVDICWISWPRREEFLKNLREVFKEYSI